MPISFFLADDDADDRSLFTESLEQIKADVNCTEAADGKELLSNLSQSDEKPHAIFLDINMPEMDGWQCLKHLKSTPDFKQIPVIMYSTSSNQKEIKLAFDLGAMCYCIKPENFTELKMVLQGIADNIHGPLPDTIKQLGYKCLYFKEVA
jgi:CheY-like chemotaxis protein